MFEKSDSNLTITDTVNVVVERSGATTIDEVDANMAAWFFDMLDLIAKITTHLPEAKVTNPDLIMEFVDWLDAMEDSFDVDPRTYKDAYRAALRQAQLAALPDDPATTSGQALAEANFGGIWKGTPAELYYDLNSLIPVGAERTQDWPQDASRRSCRLSMLQAGLMVQGVSIKFGGGKDHSISISIEKGPSS